MRPRIILSLVVLAAALVGACRKDAATKKLPSAKEAFEALINEYAEERQKLLQTSQTVQTEDERRVVPETLLSELDAKFGERFLDFARKYPEEEQAVQAVVWLCIRSELGPQTEQLQDEAIDLYVRHHIESRTLPESIGWLTAAAKGNGGEKLLRTILEKSPHRQAQGAACLYLAEHMRANAEVAYYQKRPEFAQLDQKTERLYQQVVDDYAGIAYQGSRLDAIAKARLSDLRTLGLGRIAPETEGEDIDGKRFKLSGYRGKVVLLSFWGFWCPPCRSMFPHERALVEQYANKPFVLLGVNTDSQRDQVKRLLKEEEITWRSWWNGGQYGAIVSQWRVPGFPSFFLLDAKGVIRFKGDLLRSPDGLHKAVQALLTELENGEKAQSKK